MQPPDYRLEDTVTMESTTATAERVRALVRQDLEASRSEYLFAMPACLQAHMKGLLADVRDMPALFLVRWALNESARRLNSRTRTPDY